MASASQVRRSIAEVSRRLLALREESVSATNAVQILVAESILPTQASAEPAFPLATAIASIITRSRVLPHSAMSIADYVGACESRGRGDAVLRLLGRLKIRRAQGRTSLGAIAVEFILLIIVLAVHSIFVLPQLQAVFNSAGSSLPPFTRLVFSLIGPSGPFLWIGLVAILVLLLWRTFPSLFGPILRPIDRLLMVLPLVGTTMRQSNSDRLAGWLGLAAADAPSQRVAIQAAQAWYQGDPLARECAEVLREATSDEELGACLGKARGFDSQFHAAISIPDRENSMAALRARWRVAETLPEFQSSATPAIAQVIFGIIVANLVIAMYLPLFRLASML